MMETLVIQPEKLSHNRYNLDRIEANTYKTRGQPVEASVNGETGIWHSVKGGIRKTPNGKEQKGLAYEILFNPDLRWLKIVPPELENETLIKSANEKLKTSAEIARVALRLSGLPDLADKTRDCTVDIRGKSVYGFETPHIGASVEYFLKEGVDPNVFNPHIGMSLADVYAEGFRQAALLYLDHGYWTADANPGNILVNLDQTTGDQPQQAKVVLIDFLGGDQKRPIDVNPRPEADELYRRKLHRLWGDNIGALYFNFLNKSLGNGIDFNRELAGVKVVFEDILPARKGYVMEFA